MRFPRWRWYVLESVGDHGAVMHLRVRRWHPVYLWILASALFWVLVEMLGEWLRGQR